jgi:hypothetical protein
MITKKTLAALRGKSIQMYQHGAVEPECGTIGLVEKARLSLILEGGATRWISFSHVAAIHTTACDAKTLRPFQGMYLQFHLRNGMRTTRGTLVAVDLAFALLRQGPNDIKNIPFAQIAGMIVT